MCLAKRTHPTRPTQLMQGLSNSTQQTQKKLMSALRIGKYTIDVKKGTL